MKSHLKKLITVFWVLVILGVLVYFSGPNGSKFRTIRGPKLVHPEAKLYEMDGGIFSALCTGKNPDGAQRVYDTGIDIETYKIISQIYIIDKNGVWEVGWEPYCHSPKLINPYPPVDTDTFTTFSSTSLVAKDKYGLIQYGKRIKGPSANLEWLGNRYYRDEQGIWKNTDYERFYLIKNLPLNITPISSTYVTDGGRIYSVTGYREDEIRVEELLGADPQTFKEIENGYVRDSSRLYYNSKLVSGVDLNTFVKVFPKESFSCGLDFWKDKNHVYHNGKVLKGIDPATFVVFPYLGRHCYGMLYVADMDHVFTAYPNETILLEDIDRQTFEQVGISVGKDKYGYLREGKRFTQSQTLYTSTHKNNSFSIVIPSNWALPLVISEYWQNFFTMEGKGDSFSILPGGIHSTSTRTSFDVSYEYYLHNKEQRKTYEFIPDILIIEYDEPPSEGDGGFPPNTYLLISPTHKKVFRFAAKNPIENYPFVSTFKVI